ncbi:MAG: hypothetical protein IBX70_12465 [Clostridia bacterium]|nr:hypothetical protein [Clostridia bacterium]
MKNKATTGIVLSILTVIIGMILNFQEFLMGSPATLKNLIVTFAYIIMWMLIITRSTKFKNRGVMRYYSIFWILTLFLSILTGYVNSIGAQVDWAIPFAILLLGQWYGINFFVGSFFTASIIMAFISLVMLTITVISLKQTK